MESPDTFAATLDPATAWAGLDPATAWAMLEWQIELGADETIEDVPINRYDAAPAAQAEHQPRPDTGTPPPPAGPRRVDPVEQARALAMQAGDLGQLRLVQQDFAHCDLRRGARSCVFADGRPDARIMIIGGAPGRQEDLDGMPFAGAEGAMLDRMFAAIGLSRVAQDAAQAVYLTTVLPWRPPQDRMPQPEEIAMMLPFLEKHVALAAPEIIVPMGSVACEALTGQKGLSRLRGQWTECMGRPAMPMFGPAQLLRQPAAKRHAWADLLELKARLDAAGTSR